METLTATVEWQAIPILAKPADQAMFAPDTWFALMIGNSRLHWAQFIGRTLRQTWDTPHLPDSSDLPQNVSVPLWVASVVPSQTALWTAHPCVHWLTLEQIPIKNLYATLGIDRALALWGAMRAIGFPVLVIDAGTALTFTAADSQGQFMGGAILPGLQMQLEAMNQRTANLPTLEHSHLAALLLPPRWAVNTVEAMQAGVVYGLLSVLRYYIETWLKQFPQGAIALTGGDSLLLQHYLKQQSAEIGDRIILSPRLVFMGMREIVCADQKS
jgi:type III pantothenate kinase